jgi:hypothetical protein
MFTHLPWENEPERAVSYEPNEKLIWCIAFSSQSLSAEYILSIALLILLSPHDNIWNLAI